MDNPEPHPSPSQADPGQLRAEINSLRYLMVSLLILIIVISGTLNIYLLRQWRSTEMEVKRVRGFVDQYNKDYFPQITNYVGKLTEYGRSHTNFVPILKRYGLDNARTSPPPATAAPPPAKTVKK
jgi:hypothetical protein